MKIKEKVNKTDRKMGRKKKSMKPKSWFFEKKKIEKLSARLTKRKKSK